MFRLKNKWKTVISVLLVFFMQTSDVFSLAVSSQIPQIFSDLTVMKAELPTLAESVAKQIEISSLELLQQRLRSELQTPGAGCFHDQYFLYDLHGAGEETQILVMNIFGLNKYPDIMEYFKLHRSEKDVLKKSIKMYFEKIGRWQQGEEITETNKARFYDLVHEIIADIELIFGRDDFDRGDEPLEVIDLLYELRELGLMKKVVRGNHDFWALINLKGLHLPWYRGYKFADDTLLSAEEKERILTFGQPTSRSDHERMLWWSRRLQEFNDEQDDFQEEYKERATVVERIFTESIKGKISGADLDIINDIRGNYFNTQVYAGFRDPGRMSLRWWREHQEKLNQMVLAPRSPGNEQVVLALATIKVYVDEMVGSLSKIREKKMSNPDPEKVLLYKVWESIMYGNYKTVEWWALDASKHPDWFESLMKEKTKRLLKEREMYIQGKGVEFLRSKEIERITSLTLHEFLREKIARYKQMDIKSLRKEIISHFKQEILENPLLSVYSSGKLLMLNDKELRKNKIAELKEIKEHLTGENCEKTESLKRKEMERIRMLSEEDLREELKHQINVNGVNYLEITGANYLEDEDIVKLSDVLQRNFKLFEITEQGDLVLHTILPLFEDERGWTFGFTYKGVLYKREKIFEGLTRIENDIKGADISNPESFLAAYEAFNLVNSWYADATTIAKPEHLKKCAEIGWRNLLDSIGIVGLLAQGHVTYFPKILGELTKGKTQVAELFKKIITTDTFFGDHGLSRGYMQCGGYTHTTHSKMLSKFNRWFSQEQVMLLREKNVFSIFEQKGQRYVSLNLSRDALEQTMDDFGWGVDLKSLVIEFFYSKGLMISGFETRGSKIVVRQPKITAEDKSQKLYAREYSTGRYAIDSEEDLEIRIKNVGRRLSVLRGEEEVASPLGEEEFSPPHPRARRSLLPSASAPLLTQVNLRESAMPLILGGSSMPLANNLNLEKGCFVETAGRIPGTEREIQFEQLLDCPEFTALAQESLDLARVGTDQIYIRISPDVFLPSYYVSNKVMDGKKVIVISESFKNFIVKLYTEAEVNSRSKEVADIKMALQVLFTKEIYELDKRMSNPLYVSGALNEARVMDESLSQLYVFSKYTKKEIESFVNVMKLFMEEELLTVDETKREWKRRSFENYLRSMEIMAAALPEGMVMDEGIDFITVNAQEIDWSSWVNQIVLANTRTNMAA